MGTNFYVRGHNRSDDYEYHLGKRSAAGPYCWDCKRTLCIDGESGIHYDKGFHDKCPSCGKKKRKEESWDESTGGRELGFNKTAPHKKTGVASCSSFSWGMKQADLEKLFKSKAGNCPCCGKAFDNQDKIIENEYGDLFTVEEFKQVLEECPVQFFDYVGEHFS